MHVVKIHEAKTNLSRLIQEVIDGEEVIISRGNNPVAKLVKIEDSSKKRELGSAEGRVKISHDFDEPLEDFKDYI